MHPDRRHLIKQFFVHLKMVKWLCKDRALAFVVHFRIPSTSSVWHRVSAQEISVEGREEERKIM